MAKINISFNDKIYQIDETSLSAASAALKSHLSTVMNGSGAVIKLGDIAYNIDSTKLSAETNEFISHLGTIAGSGHKVVVNSTEYGIDSAKLQGAISDIEAVLAGIGEERLEGDGQEYFTLAPTALTFRSTAPLNELQEVQVNGVTVDPANYTLEEGSTVVTLLTDYLKTLNADNYDITVVSENSSASGSFSVVEPSLNEHGFYYNQPYGGYVEALGQHIVFFIREDGTLDIISATFVGGEVATYTVNGDNILVSCSMGNLTGAVSEDGTEIYFAEFAATARLGDEHAVADGNYVYVYDSSLNGYVANVIVMGKAAYGAIKTGINGRPTVKLKDYMFAYNDNLLIAPTIPNDVVIIGKRAFVHCTNLTNVVLPDSLTNIEEGAFEGCLSLFGVVIPDGVESIGNCAFLDCKRLARITIPGSVTSIGDYAFDGCTGITRIAFDGTIAQWAAIRLGSNVFGSGSFSVLATEVVCSDGTISL